MTSYERQCKLNDNPDISELRELWCSLNCKHSKYRDKDNMFVCRYYRYRKPRYCGDIIWCPLKQSDTRPIN